MRPKQSGASRRHFLVGATTAAGAAVAGFPMIAVAQPPAVLRFQGAWPAADLFHEYALDYAKKFNEMSGGRVRIEVLAAGAVVKPPELLDAVHKGALDGCHAVPDLWSRKDSAFSLFGAGPPLGLDSHLLLAWMEYGGGRQLYEELYARLQYHNVVGFVHGAMQGQGYQQPAPVFEVLFNRKRYESLPAEVRAVARYAAQAASADASWKTADLHSAEHSALRLAKGARFVKTPPDVLRAQLKAWSAIAEKRARDNPYYERIFKSQQAWARRVVGWALDTSVDPRIAYDYWFAQPPGAVGSGKP